MSRDRRSEELRRADAGIISAAFKGDIEGVQNLVRNNGTSPNFQETGGQMRTALIAAVIGGFVEVAEFLLESGADVNLRDNEQRTPLIFAVTNNRVQCVVLLLHYNADTSLATRNGWTPLYIAINKGYIEIALTLIHTPPTNTNTISTTSTNSSASSSRPTSNLTQRTTVGGTVLMVACAQGHTDIANALIEQGADVNDQDNQMWTALMRAADKGHAQVVNLLLQSGADVTVKDRMGQDALSLAMTNNHAAVVEALTSHIHVSMKLSEPQEISQLEDMQVSLPSPPSPTTLKRKLGGDDTSIIKTEREPLTAQELCLLQMDADYTLGRWCGDSAAVQRILTAADNGDVWACAYAALLYFNGCCAFAAGGAAADKYAKIAMAGLNYASSPETLKYAHFLLAMLLYEGIGTDENKARAMDLLHTISEDFKCGANPVYALYLLYQQSETQTNTDAIVWLHGAAVFQHPQALFDLGYHCVVGYASIEINPAQAMVYFERAAALGHAGAMNMIGLLYQHGTTHTPVDAARAYQYYTQASERLNPAGMYNLGICLLEGTVAAQDLPRAAALFQDAARLGYAKAQVEAGMCALNGTGVQPNDVEAVEYFKMAAEQGHVEGLYRLGWCLSAGRGVDQNIRLAKRYLENATERGHECARIELAFLLARVGDRAAVEEHLQIVLPVLQKIGDGVLYVALPEVSLRNDEDGVELRETNGMFRVCTLDPQSLRIEHEGPPVKLTRQWLLHAAPVLKVGLALLALHGDGDTNKNISGIDAEHLHIAMSLVHDPQRDHDNYTPDIICAGDSEDMIQVAYQTIKG